MSAEARRNGWRGFENIAVKVPGGYEYWCDGMPSMTGCGERIAVTRRWSKIGKKKSGWVVCYGLDGPGDMPFAEMTEPDLDVVLTFCPACVIQGKVTVTPTHAAYGCDHTNGVCHADEADQGDAK